MSNKHSTARERFREGCIYIAVISAIATTASVSILSFLFLIRGEPDRVVELGRKLLDLATDPSIVALTVLVYLALAAIYAPFVQTLCQLRREKNLCTHCSYPRKDLPTANALCPECGHTPDP